jgi:hypothetical protein
MLSLVSSKSGVACQPAMWTLRWAPSIMASIPANASCPSTKISTLFPSRTGELATSVAVLWSVSRMADQPLRANRRR